MSKEAKYFLAFLFVIALIYLVSENMKLKAQVAELKAEREPNIQYRNVDAVAVSYSVESAQSYGSSSAKAPETAPIVASTAHSEAVAEVTAPTVAPNADFQHSDDFRSVYTKGVRYQFTLNQSLVFKAAWEAKQKGFPEVHQATLLKDVGAANQKRLKDTFKNNKDAFNALFSHGSRQGTFQLNVG